ncbi:hypothetical protein [Spirulina major]|uniref:hypothetical protein n=1 Tax=Spirulina major TaxID=270636 RepID=UPI000934FCE9|nr:hypothetical protein [Spirulina major]
MHPYLIYRTTLLIISVFGVVNLSRQIQRQRDRYQNLPPGIQTYLKEKGSTIFSKHISQQRSAIALNVFLLILLIGLNVLSWA